MNGKPQPDRADITIDESMAEMVMAVVGRAKQQTGRQGEPRFYEDDFQLPDSYT